MSRLTHVDKIVIGELTLNKLGISNALIAKAKLVSSENGTSYASMTVQNWSPSVHQKLEELTKLMEEEIELLFFDETASKEPVATPRNPGGIGEHLGDGDDALPA